jgi:hypothetical protein
MKHRYVRVQNERPADGWPRPRRITRGCAYPVDRRLRRLADTRRGLPLRASRCLNSRGKHLGPVVKETDDLSAAVRGQNRQVASCPYESDRVSPVAAPAVFGKVSRPLQAGLRAGCSDLLVPPVTNHSLEHRSTGLLTVSRSMCSAKLPKSVVSELRPGRICYRDPQMQRPVRFAIKPTGRCPAIQPVLETHPIASQ